MRSVSGRLAQSAFCEPLSSVTFRYWATQIGQAELSLPQQPAREHGVENRARHKVVVLAEKPQIVIRAMHDEFMLAQRFQERAKVNARQRIDQFISVRRGDLDEANLLRVGVEAVSFGIEGNPRGAVEARHQFVQLQVVINHLHRQYKVKPKSPKEENLARHIFRGGAGFTLASNQINFIRCRAVAYFSTTAKCSRPFRAKWTSPSCSKSDYHGRMKRASTASCDAPFLLPMGVMVVGSVLLAWLVGHLLGLTNWVDHTDRVIAEARTCEKLAVDMETGLRGYLITGDPSLMQPFNEAESQLGTELESLSQQVSDNPFQAERVETIRNGVRPMDQPRPGNARPPPARRGLPEHPAQCPGQSVHGHGAERVRRFCEG